MKKEFEKRRGILLLALALIYFNLIGVFALGITPGRTTIDFTPGLEKEISLSIINNEKKDMGVVLDVRGELNGSVILDEAYLEILGSEESKTINYKIKLPERFDKPGLHEAEIVALEVPKSTSNSNGQVGSRVAVISQLHVNVPYPGKYLELEPQIINAQADGTVLFLIAARNRGKVDVAKAKSTIDIYNSLGEKLIIIETDEREIKSGDRVEMIGKWTATVEPGKYRAYITTVYDGESVSAEKEFDIGKKLITIQSIEVNDFKLGEIAKFNALVENSWNEKATNSYLNLQVFNDENEVMADIKSQTYDIEPQSKINMIAYWDTIGVKKGTYDGKLFLKYNQGSFDRDVTLKVDENSIQVFGLNGEVLIEKLKKSNLQTVLIWAVVILVIMNIMWFVILRKFMFKKKYNKGVSFDKNK